MHTSGSVSCVIARPQMCLCVSTNVAVVVTVWVCQHASVCLHNVCELRSVRCMSPRL